MKLCRFEQLRQFYPMLDVIEPVGLITWMAPDSRRLMSAACEETRSMRPRKPPRTTAALHISTKAFKMSDFLTFPPDANGVCPPMFVDMVLGRLHESDEAMMGMHSCFDLEHQT